MEHGNSAANNSVFDVIKLGTFHQSAREMPKGRGCQHQPSSRASKKPAIACCESACRQTRIHGSGGFWMLKTLVSKAVCRRWRQKEVGELTNDGRTLKCNGYGKMKLGLEQAQPMIVEVPVIDGQLLGFHLLLGIDVIKELRGVHMT